MTSTGNVEFVRSTRLYDEVLAYDALDHAVKQPSLSVDFAGNSALLHALHDHFVDELKYSCLVGATHIEARSQGLGGISGPKPTLFFAPDHGVALNKSVGPEKAGEMMASGWMSFLKDCGESVAIDRRAGLEAARAAFVEMVGGGVDPSVGIVIEP